MDLPAKFAFEDAVNLSSIVDIVPGFKGEVSQFRTSLDLSRDVDRLHKHPFIQIWYVRGGSYRHCFAGTDFILGKGALMIVPPYYPHYLDTRGDSELVRCEFSQDFIADLPPSEIRDSLFNLVYLEPVLVNTNQIEPYHYFTGDAAQELETIFEELRHEYEKHDAFSSMFVRANIVRLLAVIAREYKIQERDKLFSNYREALDNALAYINTHYMEKIYLEDVCKIALMSERSFFYLFKQIIGMPFSKYLQYLRVLRAQELLSSTDRTQYDISLECGFQSLTYFHRVFKKFTGLLPGQYRQQNPDAV